MDELLPTNDVATVLVENHRRFLAFLLPRVESKAVAEEILQNAFVRGLEKADTVRDDESIVAWFYRMLRNALVDHYRRRSAEGRALEKHGREILAEGEGFEHELKDAVCACVGELVDTLKAEYAEVIRRVDVDGAPVPQVANELGITPNNAGVRLHRARQALRKRVEQTCGTCASHGCIDCTCGTPGGGCES